ncbi:ribonuclease H-like domain-containing protein [Tanacetum coccineum]
MVEILSTLEDAPIDELKMYHIPEIICLKERRKYGLAFHLQKVQNVYFSTQVGSFLDHPTICIRCYDVIAGQSGRALAVVTCAPVKNGSWILVPRPNDANLVRSMWLFKHKFHVDGTLSRYMARLVANGSSHQLSVDFDETFSLVVKLATIRTVLSLAISQTWPIHQLDVKNGFLNSDLSETGSQAVYLLIYMDDIILKASSIVLLQQIIDSLHKEFDMTDLGALNYFLGISVVRHSTVDSKAKLGPDDVPVHDPTLYRSLAGGLQYLTFTRPDLSYAVQQVCLYMHDLREPRFAALKRILRYVQGTIELGLHLYASATTSLVGYTEAEYRGVANVVAETTWLRNLLHELHSPLLTATLVYCDNISAVCMSAKPVQHQRTKHIEIDIHFVRDMVKAGHVRLLHVPSRFQYADVFTKGLPSALFEDFCSSLCIRRPPALTAGAY